MPRLDKCDGRKSLPFILCLFLASLSVSVSHSDQLIMKDGTVLKGKILKENSKLILIGNPPFDPKEHLVRTQDVEKIVYEEFKPLPPAERRYGFMLETQLLGNVFSSGDLSLNPAPELFIGGGIRVHPCLEIDGGLGLQPAVSASNGGLSVSNATVTRGYTDFSWTDRLIMGRIYPFFMKTKWKTEPYLLGGYTWAHLSPKGTDDTLKGQGWLVGAGATYPLNDHWFADGRLTVRHVGFDTIDFLDSEGGLRPVIGEDIVSLSAGISYRF